MNENNYKGKSTMRIICFTVILLMALSVLPTSMQMTVNADASMGTAKDIEVDTSGINSSVYFGSSDGSMKWRVVTSDGITMTLFCDGQIGDNRRYDPSAHNSWTGSEICGWLNGEFLNERFTETENDAITTYSSVQETGYGGNYPFRPNQKIVLPSTGEVGNNNSGHTGTWDMNSTERRHTAYWWLRSPGDDGSSAAYVGSSGFVYADDVISGYVRNTWAVRPALKLNLNSVLFTSDANKVSKTAAYGSSLEKISDTPTSVALTLTDSALSLDTDTISVSGIKGGSVEIDYEDVIIGEGMSVSVMICDEDTDEMLYYGRPVDLSKNDAESSGTAEVEIPSDIDEGGYTIKIFNEQVNGTNLTDYASTPQEVALTVEEDNPVADEYTVTLDVNGGQALPNNKLKVTNGKSYGTMPTPKRTGYTFSGWYTEKTGGKKIMSGTTVMLTADQTLFSRWSPNKYKVTFMGNKGKVKKSGKYKSSKLTKSLVYDKKYGNLPKAKRTGYKFKGWYTKKSGGKKVTANTVMNHTKTTKLYARWTPNAKIANCSWVHLRKAPGAYKITKKYVKKGTKVSILKTVKVNGKYKWYKIRVGNKVGYIYSKYVKRI